MSVTTPVLHSKPPTTSPTILFHAYLNKRGAPKMIVRNVAMRFSGKFLNYFNPKPYFPRGRAP